MALKCDLCGEKIETLFLEKISGTYICVGKKRKAICSACQKKYKDKLKEQPA